MGLSKSVEILDIRPKSSLPNSLQIQKAPTENPPKIKVVSKGFLELLFKTVNRQCSYLRARPIVS